MTMGEALYLALVVGAFLVFSAALFAGMGPADDGPKSPDRPAH